MQQRTMSSVSQRLASECNAPEHVWAGRITAILCCEAIGIIGALTTPTGNSPWFRTLRKPRYEPPAWVFRPVWTILYALMGLSLHELWRRRDTPQGRSALRAFGTQLFLNAIWTPVFFGRQSLSGGFAIIVGLWISLFVTIRRAWKVSEFSGALLLAYWAWVTFAAVLNGSVLALNPRRDALLQRLRS